MDALVTGGTGFVGANVVRELLGAGATVRVLARASSDRRALADLSVEIAEGDLLDRASLERAARGVSEVYHVAADYRLWAPDPREIYHANVDGTRAVLETAAAAGARRIVHTSSVGALGIPADGTPGTEDTPVTLADMVGDYKRSKFFAEAVARELAGQGVPVVIVNPSAPIGPWDVKPTPTGQMVLDFMCGRMFATMDTGLNLVHVRDVAIGHLRAAQRGALGERYILGCANVSLADIGSMLAEITGVPAPRWRVPYPVAWSGAFCLETVARFTRATPRVSLSAVRMAKKRMYFSAARAVRELGLPQTDVREALRDAVDWFTRHGHARQERRGARLARGA